VKVRYQQTALGILWVLLQPAATVLVFTFLFGRMARIPSDGLPYTLFVFAGLLPWIFFSSAISNSGNSLVGNSNLVTKVYFPRMIIPAAAVGAGLTDFGVGLLALSALMIYYGIAASWQFLLLPVAIALTVLLALGAGMLMSALNVAYRDVRYALPFLTQIWMFATPIIYPSSLVPERWRLLLALNPMTGIVEAYRACLFGMALDLTSLTISSVATLSLLLFSAYFFRRMERTFSDVI
jgi:lipopolysaccharide transport system permease protein